MPTFYLTQAIRTKIYLNRNGNRCASATYPRWGSVRRQLPYDVTGDACHQWILAELLAKFAMQDPEAARPSSWAGGILPDATAAWVSVG